MHDASELPARRSKPLPRAAISRLGKMADSVIARLYSLPAHTVRRERISRGIYAFQRIDWTPDKIKILGTMSDEQVGKRLGVGSTTIFSKRTRLGIAAFGPSFEETRHVWNTGEIRKLGTMPDARLAAKLGVKPEAVASKRTSLGISSSGKQYEPRRPWTNAELKMLGQFADTHIAKVSKRGRRHVRSKRESLGIPPFQKQFIEPWPKKMIQRLGKATDADIALELGVAVHTVSLQRARLGIAAFG